MSDKVNYLLQIRDGYLYVKYSGSLTKNDADSLYSDYQSILKFIDFDLKVILDSRDFVDCPPDLISYSTKLNKLLNDNGLVCKALIAESDIYKKMFTKLDKEFVKQKIEVFDNIKDAESWISKIKK